MNCFWSNASRHWNIFWQHNIWKHLGCPWKRKIATNLHGMPVLNLAGISHFTLKNIKPNELNSIKNYIYMFNIQIKYRRIYASVYEGDYLFICKVLYWNIWPVFVRDWTKSKCLVVLHIHVKILNVEYN